MNEHRQKFRSHEVQLKVPFHDLDPLQIVWHGNYVKYMEDGREAFGKEYDLGYMNFFNAELIVPIVKIDINYKKDLRYEDSILIETRFVDSPAAKIIFEYKIYNMGNDELVTTGSTTQVFLNKERQLLLNTPPMFEEWKRRWKLL